MPFVQDGTCSQENDLGGPFGPVGDSETLVRVVRRPEHINKKTNEVKPGLFSHSDISKKGVSTTRFDKVTISDMEKYARAVAEMKPDQALAGLRGCSAKSIRSIQLENGQRAFCILEDPASGIPNIPDNPAHAVAISSTVLVEEDKIIELQTKLVQAFSRVIDLRQSENQE